MLCSPLFKQGLAGTLFCATLAVFSASNSNAQLGDGLVAYWPLDQIIAGKSPDKTGGYDMDVKSLTDDDVVEGKIGNAYSFDASRNTILEYVSAEVDDGDLPLDQHEDFSISMWVKGDGLNQPDGDRRVFSEGSTQNNNPLFNLGTANNSNSGELDFYFRGRNGTVNHLRSEGEPFDDEWRHIVFVQDDNDFTVYIDGELSMVDGFESTPGVRPLVNEDDTYRINTTTIGGIRRAAASHFFTGLIDDVAVWKRTLDADEAMELYENGLSSIFSPLLDGMIATWPLDTLEAGKSPDLTGSFNMEAKNLTEEDIVDGKFGKAYQFEAGRSTILEYVSEPGDGLPLDQYENFTVSMWVKGDGLSQPDGDRRVFSEGSTQNNNPLFNLGTANNSNSEELDIYIRGRNGTVNHVRTEGTPFDDEWHHIMFVQEDNDYTIYIDGAITLVDGFDTNPSVRPIVNEDDTYRVNTTTIGGIRRAAGSHFYSGLIDAVAVWNRALGEADAEYLFENAPPTPTTPPCEAEIKSFVAERRVVPSGEVAILKWEGSKEATYTLEPGVGDVTANTEFGVGLLEVPVTEATEFTLIAGCGDDTVDSEVTVTTIPEVEPGWYLLGNFDDLETGLVVEKAVPFWFNPDEAPSVNISKDDEGSNQVLSYDPGQATLFTELQTFEVPDGGKRSAFFQVYLDDTGDGLQYHIGMTNKALRGFTGDTDQNLGGYIIINRLEGDDTAVVELWDGTVGEFELESEIWYNIWIDVTNSEGDAPDLISAFIAPHNDPSFGNERDALFEDMEGDRGNTNNLVFFYAAAKGGNSADNGLFIDNVFVSKDGLLESNPFGEFEVVDTDGDGMPDPYEEENELDINTNDAEEDKDGDGLKNLDEFNRRLAANNADTDGDGRNDGDEVNGPIESDPRKSDTDRDGINDGEELVIGTSPTKKDSDDDSFDDGMEVLFGGNPTNKDVNFGNFTVRNVQADGDQLTSMEVFVDVLADEDLILDEITEEAKVINYRDNSEGRFPENNQPFPLFGDEDVAEDDYGLHVTGSFFIAEAGVRTFAVNSDDGNQLFIDGELVVDDPATHGSRDAFGAVDLTAGLHTLELFFYERSGGSQVELFVNTDLGEVDSLGGGNWVLLPAAGDAPSAGLAIIDITLSDGKNVTLTFTSTPGKTYSVETSADLENWLESEDGLEADSDITSWTDTGVPADTKEIYYRILEQQ